MSFLYSEYVRLGSSAYITKREFVEMAWAPQIEIGTWGKLKMNTYAIA